MKKPVLLLASFVLTLFSSPAFGGEEAERTSAEGCTHVEFLDSSSRNLAKKVPPTYLDHIVTPGANQKDVARMALDALPRLVCSSVKHIAFVDMTHPNSALALVDRRYPATIVVVSKGAASEAALGSVSYVEETDSDIEAQFARQLGIWPKIVKSIIHEAIHCATYMLESVNDNPGAFESDSTSRFEEFDYEPDGEVWDGAAKSEARRIVKKNLARLDLIREWDRIQRQFIEYRQSSDTIIGKNGLSTQFWDGKGEAPREDLGEKPPIGFMSYYATKESNEDIAESAAWPIFIQAYEIEKSIRIGNMPNLSVGTFLERNREQRLNIVPPWDYVDATACKALSLTNDKRIPSSLTAVYLKLNYLVDLELISRDAFDACIGDGEIQLKRMGNSGDGFQSFVGFNLESHSADFKDELEYSLVLGDATLSANGRITWVKEHPAKMKLRVSRGTYRNGMERGIFRIDPTCLIPPLDRGPAFFAIYHSETNDRFLSACDALVVVLRSTEKRLEGFVIVFAYFKRIVPERPKDPTTITFVHNR